MIKPTPANILLVFKSAVKMVVDDQLDLTNKMKYILGYKVIEFKVNPDVTVNLHRKALRMFAPFVSLDSDAINEMKSFMRLTQGMSCLIDIGAFYGVFSAFFTSLNKSAAAYAIEPSTEPFDMLEKLIELNPSLKIKPFKFALGETSGKLKMRRQWKHFVAIGKHEQNRDSIDIKAVSLDEFIESNKIKPDAIKIDTEGYEYAILKGGKKYLTRNKPIIFLEMHPKLLEIHNVKMLNLVDLIHSFKYHIYNLKGELVDLSKLLSKENFDGSIRVVCRKEIDKKNKMIKNEKL